MNGPFCIEGIYDENAKFTAFEFSARIVAGTNIYMDGSPYYGLLYGESISMGRRIAREIKDADPNGPFIPGFTELADAFTNASPILILQK